MQSVLHQCVGEDARDHDEAISRKLVVSSCIYGKDGTSESTVDAIMGKVSLSFVIPI